MFFPLHFVYSADDLHPTRNVEKMKSGVPLSDDGIGVTQ